MFDCVNGGGFSSRCKSRIKLIRSRINVIKKRRADTIGFLKNSMAELIKNGFEVEAYGRATEVISELNRLSCYESIERFCECILENLSNKRKQRVCPPESAEAVSTLIFAAARFADLPELCDLRCMFMQRYGSYMESSICREFVEKFESSDHSMDEKLQLMGTIAREFSLIWDPIAFRIGISHPISSASDGSKKAESLQKVKCGAILKECIKNVPVEDKISNRERWRTPPRVNAITDNPEVTCAKRFSEDHSPTSTPNKLEHLRSSDTPKLRKTDNVSPCVKKKGDEYAKEVQKHHVDDNQSRPSDNLNARRGISYHREQKNQQQSSLTVRKDPVAEAVAMVSVSGNENGCELVDDFSSESPHKMRSAARKKQLRMMPNENHDNESLSRNPMSRRRGNRGRGNHLILSDERDEEEIIMDELLMHYSKKPNYKSSKLQNGHKSSDLASDASKSQFHENNMASLPNSESSFAPKTLKVPRALDSNRSPLHQNIRVASLPSQPATHLESDKGPARAVSLEPNMLRPYVHPKLPDYDDLAARFAALKGEIGKQ